MNKVWVVAGMSSDNHFGVLKAFGSEAKAGEYLVEVQGRREEYLRKNAEYWDRIDPQDEMSGEERQKAIWDAPRGGYEESFSQYQVLGVPFEAEE